MTERESVWDFIRDWQYPDNKCGIKIVNYDNLLYPQNEEYFDKIISKENWKLVQKEAKRLLEEEDKEFISKGVRKHWKSIVKGKVPFGYKVEN